MNGAKTIVSVAGAPVHNGFKTTVIRCVSMIIALAQVQLLRIEITKRRILAVKLLLAYGQLKMLVAIKPLIHNELQLF